LWLWLTPRAIDQATAKLGFCYLNGVGVSKDNGEAIRLYMVAANEGTLS
jgi:TPR repeat protein